jgi:hypothetical protein
VIVMGEIRRGAERIRRRDSRQALVLESWLEQLQATYADRIMNIDVRRRPLGSFAGARPFALD